LSLEQAIAQHFAAALQLEDAGRFEEALARYDDLLKLAPSVEDAVHNRGLLLVRLGRLQQAQTNAREWVIARPDSLRARSALADLLLATGAYREAVENLDVVLARSPADIPALVRRGIALSCLREYEQASSSFARARATNTVQTESYVRRVTGADDVEAVLSPQSIFLWRRYVAQGACEWADWDEYVSEFRHAAHTPAILEPALAFSAFHLPLTGQERQAIARNIARRFEQRIAPLPARTPRNGRLRVGLLSPDFRDHVNAYLLLPFVQLLDRQRFELYAYSLTRDDGSAIGAKLRAAADLFRDLDSVDDARAAAQIREDSVDILLDIGGHSAGARFGITARRPAPLQVSYLGFAGSLGSVRVDYAIVDQLVAPSTSINEWSEALVRLPQTYYLYDFRDAVPQGGVTRAAYGLPEQAFVYCAFHKPEKITPDAFALWMAILERVPHSVLWFMSTPSAAQMNLRSAAAQHGVAPSRLHFAPFEPRERYLARQRLGDLMLDALHHSAMTTGCDALGVGLPMLTLKGASMASRAGESLVAAAGIPELVVPDATAFVERAVELATRPARLRQLGDRLRANRQSAPLFDTRARVRELERAFELMQERALRGQPPAAFAVDRL
jgi:predicted O-linked N-acetylglucosamine transferase (SPINDLY family)